MNIDKTTFPAVLIPPLLTLLTLVPVLPLLELSPLELPPPSPVEPLPLSPPLSLKGKTLFSN